MLFQQNKLLNQELVKGSWYNYQAMRAGENRKGRSSEKRPSISNLVQLKLMESEHSASNRINKHQYSKTALASFTGTPSTTNDRNFHSCRLEERGREAPSKPLAHLQLLGKERGCSSATKILTLQQIKVEEERAKLKKGIGQSPSRKIFLSISRQNSQSLQKHRPSLEKRQDPELNAAECELVEQRPQRGGIKLNIYKNMARRSLKLPQQ